MKNPVRAWAALGLLAVSLLLFALFLPLPDVLGGEERTLSLGRLLSASFDPIPAAIGLLALLFFAWSAKREPARGGASPLCRGMIAGAHGFLWASFAVTAFLFLAFFVTGGGQDSFSWIGTRYRMDLIELGGWIPIALVAIAEFLDMDEVERRTTPASRAPRGLVHALDAVSTIGLLLCTGVLFLRIFTSQSPPIDRPADWQPIGFLAPTFGAVTGALALWSLLLTAALPWILVRVSGSRGAGLGFGLSGGRLALPLGALGAIAVGVVVLNTISSTGGQVDPTQLQALVGQMSIPLLIGILVWALGSLGGSRTTADVPAAHRESMD